MVLHRQPVPPGRVVADRGPVARSAEFGSVDVDTSPLEALTPVVDWESNAKIGAMEQVFAPRPQPRGPSRSTVVELALIRVAAAIPLSAPTLLRPDEVR